LAAFLAVVLLCGAARPAAAEDARVCQPLPDGRVLVGTGSGLLLLDRDGVVTARWGVVEGLPGARVDALVPVAGPVGWALWVGTEAGLARVVVDADADLRPGRGGHACAAVAAGPPVRAVLDDPQGTLVGTWGGGLQRLAPAPRGGGQALAPVPFAAPAAAPGAAEAEGRPRVSALARWRDAVWVATAGGGLYRLEGGALVRADVALPSDVVFGLAATPERLLVGTLGGLVALDDGGARVLDPADVRAIALPPPPAPTAAPAAAGAQGAGGPAAAGDPLLATLGAGLLRLPPDGRPAPVDGLAAPFVAHVARAGDTVCAAATDGVHVRRGGGPWQHLGTGRAPSADLTALAFDGERLWAGTFDRGLGWFDAAGTWRAFEHPLVGERINALAVEPVPAGPPRLWVGTARGLALVEGDRVRRWGRADGLPHAEVHALAVRRSGGVALGVGRGAALVTPQDGVRPLGPKQRFLHRAVWAVAEDDRGTLWFGTTAGLFRWSGGRRPQRFAMATGHLPDDWVTAVAVQGRTLWVGTYSAGVVRLERAGRDLLPTRVGGALHVNPGGLLLAGGRLWAATMEGLFAAPLAAPGEWARRADVPPGTDVTALLPRSAEALWVATRRGLLTVQR
jgi:ligand-binding sensor domain-containing protein